MAACLQGWGVDRSHVLLLKCVTVHTILALVPGSHPAWAGLDLEFLGMIARGKN